MGRTHGALGSLQREDLFLVAGNSSPWGLGLDVTYCRMFPCSSVLGCTRRCCGLSIMPRTLLAPFSRELCALRRQGLKRDRR